MLIAIDVGNTNIVFAVFDDGGDICGEWRIQTMTEMSSEELSDWLDRKLKSADIDVGKITEAIIATVVPDMLPQLKSLCNDFIHVKPIVVGEDGVKLDVEVLVDNPNEVGADRLVNAVAARVYGPPLIVVDFGTATTFDVIDENGNYAGGVIAPGINLSLTALHSAAAKLPEVQVVKPEKVIGKATVPAMQSGIYWGYVSMVEGIVKRIKVEFDKNDMKVIATGGLAHLFSEGTDVIKKVDSALTLNGLYQIARHNQQ